jgi:branched-chain amino acid aminotransferase
VSVAKKAGYAMSLWLHGPEDYISEAGAMNMFIMKQAEDGCELLVPQDRPQ